MSRDVLDRLNALIRRRSFVAQGDASETGSAVGGRDGAQAGAAPAGDDEDVPVLTEVVAPGAIDVDQPDILAAATGALTEATTAELAGFVEQRLARELPALLDEAIARLSAEVRSGVGQIAAAAVRDYLNQHTPGPAPDSPPVDRAR